jgi:hypothetical protein
VTPLAKDQFSNPVSSAHLFKAYRQPECLADTFTPPRHKTENVVMAGKQSGKKCQRHVPATSYRDLTTPPRVILVNSTFIGALINYAPI